jgi:hypothetical protein
MRRRRRRKNKLTFGREFFAFFTSSFYFIFKVKLAEKLLSLSVWIS